MDLVVRTLPTSSIDVTLIQIRCSSPQRTLACEQGLAHAIDAKVLLPDSQDLRPVLAGATPRVAPTRPQYPWPIAL